jgi:hypothetical protein
MAVRDAMMVIDTVTGLAAANPSRVTNIRDVIGVVRLIDHRTT